MVDFFTKRPLVERLYKARGAWTAALARLPPEELTRPGFCGDWSATDVVAHSSSGSLSAASPVFSLTPSSKESA